LKGFLQTWLVHMRAPLRAWRELGTAGFLTLQTVTLGVFASALLHPFLVAHTLWTLSPGQISRVNLLLAGFSLAILVAGYGFAIATNLMGLRRAGLPVTWGLLLSLPFYWLLITCAAWMALLDLIVAPFHWHKTQHGLSAFVQRQGRG
jgi:glycosyltransferase XagB